MTLIPPRYPSLGGDRRQASRSAAFGGSRRRWPSSGDCRQRDEGGVPRASEHRRAAPPGPANLDFLRSPRAYCAAPQKPGFRTVGKVWNSLDSLVRNEGFQWVTGDLGPKKNSSRCFHVNCRRLPSNWWKLRSRGLLRMFWSMPAFLLSRKKMHALRHPLLPPGLNRHPCAPRSGAPAGVSRRPGQSTAAASHKRCVNAVAPTGYRVGLAQRPARAAPDQNPEPIRLTQTPTA